MEVSKPITESDAESLIPKFTKLLNSMLDCEIRHDIVFHKKIITHVSFKFTCNIGTYRNELNSIGDQFHLILCDPDGLTINEVSSKFKYQVRNCSIMRKVV